MTTSGHHRPWADRWRPATLRAGAFAPATSATAATDVRLTRLDPLLTMALAVHGATVAWGRPFGLPWLVLGAVLGLGLAGLAGWRGTRAAAARAIALCVSATALAPAFGGPLSPFGWWYLAVVVIFGILLNAEVGLGVTAIAAACYVALLGAPGSTFTAEAGGRLLVLVVVGWVVWRIATVYGEALASNRRLALSDALTGLPNRAVLLDRLNIALARSTRRPSHIAVLFLDLDDFKVVNDSLGHDAGDELLVRVAMRLTGAVRPSDTVARFGGDEFIVLCDDLEDPADAATVARRICDRLSQPLQLSGRELVVSTSVGIAVHRGNGRSGEELLRDADAAMYRAKRRGGRCYEMFDAGMRSAAHHRLTLEAGLRRALRRDEFRLLYQPQVRLSDDRVVGFEALLRWQRDGDGPAVAPGEFIALAEETGLIVPIGEWVLHEACQRAAGWHRQGREAWVSVNVSARQFADPQLGRTVERAIDNAGGDASTLCLEITETAAMQELDRALDTLRGLRALGVEIHIDDFGTGWSSMSQLRRFPVTALKVDRSFVAEMARPDEGPAIPTAIITLAHSLGLSAVAEGVETVEQLTALRDLGCDVAQGYYLGRPAVLDLTDGLAAGAQRIPANRPDPSPTTSEEERLARLLTRLREEREHP